MSRARQTSFLTHETFHAAFRHLARREHGGTLSQGRRKRERPLDPRRPLHVILRSTRAKDGWSMLRARHERRIKHLVHAVARHHGVRIYRFANSGNHLHLVIHATKREGYQNYLRSLSGLIARAVTGARKGHAKGRFWDALAYSRVVEWGRDLKNLNFYVILNELEGLGIWSRRFRGKPQPNDPGERPPPNNP